MNAGGVAEKGLFLLRWLGLSGRCRRGAWNQELAFELLHHADAVPCRAGPLQALECFLAHRAPEPEPGAKAVYEKLRAPTPSSRQNPSPATPGRPGRLTRAVSHQHQFATTRHTGFVRQSQEGLRRLWPAIRHQQLLMRQVHQPPVCVAACRGGGRLHANGEKDPPMCARLGRGGCTNSCPWRATAVSPCQKCASDVETRLAHRPAHALRRCPGVAAAIRH